MFVRATRYPRLLGPAGLRRLLVEELVDQLTMRLLVQVPLDDQLGSQDGETRHLAPQLGHRLGTLRLRLLAGGLDNPLGLLLCRRPRLRLDALGSNLGLRHQLADLTPG